MGRTASTEPQCLYKGDLYLYLFSVYTECDLRKAITHYFQCVSFISGPHGDNV